MNVQPGDLIVDGRGHLWFAHGNPHLGLHLTGTGGACAPVEEVERLHGPLTLHYRPGRTTPAHNNPGCPDHQGSAPFR